MPRIGSGWTTERRTKALVCNNDDGINSVEAENESVSSSSSLEEEAIGAFAIRRANIRRDNSLDWDPTEQPEDQQTSLSTITEQDMIRDNGEVSMSHISLVLTIDEEVCSTSFDHLSQGDLLVDAEINVVEDTQIHRGKLQLDDKEQCRRSEVVVLGICLGLLVVLIVAGVLIGILLSGRDILGIESAEDESSTEVGSSIDENQNNEDLDLSSIGCFDSDFQSALSDVDPFLQCRLCDSIQNITPELEAKYNATKEKLEIKISALPIESCEASNLALMWLATDSPEFRTTLHVTQRYVLATLYASFHGQNWHMKRNWVSREKRECDWEGVSCDKQEQITGISLWHNGLDGAWTEELIQILSRLQRLFFLDFHGNMMHGAIPYHHQLLHLDISENLISGPVNFALSAMTNLQTLILHTNHLSGGLPDWPFHLLTSLKTINTSNNFLLNGVFPESLSLLTKLTNVDFSHTGIGGTIPSSIVQLTSLEELICDFARLSGTIPDLSPLKNLRKFQISYNSRVGGTLEAFQNLTSLDTLSLNLLSITGTIPTSIGDMQLLKLIQLEGNGLSGSIPTEFGRLRGLESVQLQENFGLSGTVPTELLAVSTLILLDIRSTDIVGTLQEEFCDIPHLFRSCEVVLECSCERPCGDASIHGNGPLI